MPTRSYRDSGATEMIFDTDVAAPVARRLGWRAALFCGAAAGVLSLAGGRAALADDPCVSSGGGTILTCTGDQSDGIAVIDPVVTLNVSNLTTTIAPAAGVDGISFLSDGPITIDSFTGYKGISVSGVGADGIFAQSGVSGSVTISHVGAITTTDGYGVFAKGTEDVSTTTAGRIRSGSDGIHVESVDDATITHFGSIGSATGYGIYAYATEGTISLSGAGDIEAELDGVRLDSRSVSDRLTVDWSGDITSRTGRGVYASSSNGPITSVTVGDIDAESDGIYLDSRSSSETLFYSHQGDVRSAGGTGVFVYSSNGPISGSTVGDIDAYSDGLHLDSRSTSTPLVFSHDGDIRSATGHGINAYASNATINAITNGNIVAELDGILLESRSSSAALTLTHTGDITARTGHGIDLFSSNGPVDLSVTGDIDANLDGVHIVNVTGAYVTVVQNGDIVTHTASDFVASDPVLHGGIYVNAAVGVVDISGSGDIDSASNGIYARSSGSGTGVTIDRSGDIDAAEIGIFAQATQGTVSVTNVGDVSGGAAGIYAYSTGADDTNTIVNQTGDIVATGGSAILPHNWLAPSDETTAGGYGIMAVSTSGSTYVTADGDITATVAGIYAFSTGDGTSVVVDQTGDITATGGSAVMPHTVFDSSPAPAGYGIFARAPAGTVTVTSAGDIDAVLEGIYAYTTGGAGQTLTVDHTGNITSSAANGIYAFTSATPVTITNVGDIDAALSGIFIDTETTETVTLTQTGNVTARGGDGIYAVATDGEIDATVTGDVGATAHAIHLEGYGNFDLTVGGGTITGASGYAGVYFEQGLTNALTNYGTIRNADGIDGVAILAENSDTTVDNYGRVIGDVDLYEWTNAFNNHEGALFEAGATVDLGEWNYLTNDGTFSPGGQGRVLTTSLTGGYVNNPDGVFLVDVDMDASSADLVEVSDDADLSGRVFVNLLSFDEAPQTFTILTTGDVVTTQELTLQQPVLLAEITYPTDQQVDLTIYGVDFNPSGLSGNPGAVGDHLTGAFYAGSPGLGPVFTALVGLTTTAAVDDALRQLTPDVMLSAKLADLYGGLDFADGLMSCKVAGGATTFGAEGQCAWARMRYDRLDQDGSEDEPGFTQDTGEFSAGAQFAAEGDWRFGFGFGAAFVDLESDGTDQEVDGTRVEGGAVAKYVPGPWLFAAALSGTYGWYDSSRRVDFGGYSDEFSGSPEVGTLNGRLRAAYTAGGDSFYVRPQVDLNATLVHLSGFSESGGAGAMTFDSETDTIVSLAPAVEVGAQADLGDGMLLRGFLRGGLDWFMDPELNVTGAFVDAADGAGDFTITTSPDDVLWTVSAGADLFTSGGITVRAAYDGKFGESTTDNSVSLKVSMDF